MTALPSPLLLAGANGYHHFQYFKKFFLCSYEICHVFMHVAQVDLHRWIGKDMSSTAGISNVGKPQQ
jgi:hypothetical protein